MMKLLKLREKSSVSVISAPFSETYFVCPSTITLSSTIMNYCARKNYDNSIIKNLALPKNLRLYFDNAKGVNQLTGTFIQVNKFLFI